MITKEAVIVAYVSGIINFTRMLNYGFMTSIVCTVDDSTFFIDAPFATDINTYLKEAGDVKVVDDIWNAIENMREDTSCNAYEILESRLTSSIRNNDVVMRALRIYIDSLKKEE